MINVALLGFGRIGQMHAQNIYLNKTLNLLYVYEKIDKLRKKAKNLYNCKIEKDYKKIFTDKRVDIIFISSPTNTHIRFIEEGIKYDKTIFCEKPLDLKTLLDAGLLKKNNNIKILAKGEFKSKLKFIGFNFSKNAKTIVEKNGGTFENLNNK